MHKPPVSTPDAPTAPARATKRPANVRAPHHWPRDPAPNPAQERVTPEPFDRDADERVRYGDWVKNGIAIDF